MDAMGKAAFDLFALALIYAGTLAITLGGVPALIRPTLLSSDGAHLVGRDGAALTGRPDPDAMEARRRYMRWAVPGVIAITIGALWQALGPLGVLLPHVQFLAVFRQG